MPELCVILVVINQHRIYQRIIMTGTIVNNQDGKGGSFQYLIEDDVLAEMVYVMSNPSLMIIEHTEVDDSLQGQGIGLMLLSKLIDYVRENNIRVIPLCPFANAMLKRKTEWQDVLRK